MTNHDEEAAVGPLTLAWVSRHLEVGERVVRTEPLHGGITAEMRRLTIGTRDGGTRDLVLRTFVNVEHAEDWLNREAGALTLLAGTGVPAPGLVAVDPTAAQCEYPSLLMTHLAGRTILDDEGVETRVPLLARQLVAIHALRPAERPREYVALTTADTVVTPKGADAAAWGAAIDVIRKPAPGARPGFIQYRPSVGPVPCVVRQSLAARSDSLRRTQNSLPSGSARTAQPAPSGSRRSSTRVAPRLSRRSTSSSRVVSGRRHR